MKRLYQELDLDLTGTAISNYIKDEPHRLSAKYLRALVPHRGLFYANSVVIRDGATELEPGKDYFQIQLHQPLSIKTGKEVVTAIIINNPQVGSDLEITYQAVGGPYATDNALLADLIESIISGTKTYSWNDIIDKPNLFRPTKHGHFISDIKGWEPIIYALERIRNTKTLSHIEIIKTILDGIDDPFEWEELSEAFPTRDNVRHDDVLYILSRKKLIGKAWIDTATPYWTTGRINQIKIDTSSFPEGTKFYWEFYKARHAPIHRELQPRGIAEGNGGIVYVDVYVPSNHTHEDEQIYLGVRVDPNQKDFDGTSKIIRFKDALKTDSAYGLMSRLDGGYDDTVSSPALFDDRGRDAFDYIGRHRSIFRYK